MDGLSPTFPDCFQYFLDIQIWFIRIGRSLNRNRSGMISKHHTIAIHPSSLSYNTNSFISHTDMQRIDISFRVHGHSFDSKFTGSFHHTARYFTTICYKNFINFALILLIKTQVCFIVCTCVTIDRRNPLLVNIGVCRGVKTEQDESTGSILKYLNTYIIHYSPIQYYC